MSDDRPREARRDAVVSAGPRKLDALLIAVAVGDEQAYEIVYDQASGWVLGVVRKVLRDPAQAEEVMQEVLLEIWRTASRFDPRQGSAASWVMTMAHRRAVDRVRSERSHASRELRAATALIDYDDVIEAVEASLDRERVRRCLAAHRAAAGVRGPGLLQRLHLPRGRRAARGAGRHGQDQDARRADQAQGLPGGVVMVPDEHDLHTLAGPYAMDAVTAAERDRFAAHLANCAQCRDDVREMREATARLGIAAAVRPRPELRDQTIRAAFLTSQLAPLVSDAPAAPASSAPPASRWRERAGRLWSLPTRLALAATVLVLVAAASLGLLANSAMRQLHHTQGQDHLIAAVLNAPDAAMLTARVTTGGTATVVMSHQEHCLVFTAHGLRPLPRGQVYELWLMGPDGDRPAGMLRPQPGGMAGPAVVLGLSPGDAIGLSIEPASGSRLPTSVLVVAISPHG